MNTGKTVFEERKEELLQKVVNQTITEDEIIELKADYGVDVVFDEEDIKPEGIPYSFNVINSYDDMSTPDDINYQKGVEEASKYLGALHTLINNGIGSEDAMVVASWIFNKELNDSTIQGNKEIAKTQNTQIQQQTI